MCGKLCKEMGYRQGRADALMRIPRIKRNGKTYKKGYKAGVKEMSREGVR